MDDLITVSDGYGHISTRGIPQLNHRSRLPGHADSLSGRPIRIPTVGWVEMLGRAIADRISVWTECLVLYLG